MTISIMRQFAKHVLLLLLRAYKWAISPLFPPACRYVPPCSEYAMEAVERYGALRGVWMAVGRVLRCHPLARGGYDPVVKTPLQGGGGASVAEIPSASSGQALRFAQDDKTS
jgi:putative membrane protein insertion efficiency factor